MLAAKAQENTFFPSVLTEEAKWLSSQRRARASGWALCRMSLEWTGGAREGAVGGLAAADWAGQLSVPQEEVHFSTPPPHLQLKVKNLQTLEVALLASEGCAGVRVWAQGQDSWVPAHHCHQTAAQLSLTEQGGWISCRLRPKIYQTGRVNLAEGPALRLTTQQPLAWG